ncbi:unnamed protein product [Heligmosomoides polygyrus]|uniref:Metalloendopeptidase n=1 Tax=Heligmosomoides polygyrus TaxID=6339 RepID=A0A183FXE1_HELPZ|nr:unnamed protein product [Heligmosomoides polygyrus]
MNTTWLRMLGTVTHEIAHSLGFYHTQSRYDRNDYVSVDMDNINPDLQYNFAQVYCSEREFCGLLLVNGVFQMTRKTSTHFGLPYDYGSMMEYDAYAFAENPNQYTIWPKNSIWTNTMGQRVAPAFSDMLEVNWLYNCSSLCSNVPVPPCRQPGYQNPRDCSSCLCPQMFGGQYCGQLPTGNAVNCNGKVIQVRIAGSVLTKVQVIESHDCIT